MSNTDTSIDHLINALKKLPGLGPRSASRIAYHLLLDNRLGARELASSLDKALNTVKHCELCNTLTDDTLCPICRDQTRDRSKICVVESPADQKAIEETLTYQGLYFVLMGLISPVQGVGAKELQLQRLIDRVEKDVQLKEVLIATPFTPEGDATAHFIAKAIASRSRPIRVTRLARGIPAGVELEYTDANTIASAIFSRRG